MRKREKRSAGWIATALFMVCCLVPGAGFAAESHPDLSAQEKYIACADCHKDATPELQKEWYDSAHGLAMVKCYQCHGTFETFKVTPTKEDCATCHADMLQKCPQEKKCWECHIPHSFKMKK